MLIHFRSIFVLTCSLCMLFTSCKKAEHSYVSKSASQILGNADYLAISYGGYRKNSRDIQPTINQIKEDLRILEAIGIKIIRTYNVQFEHAPNILKAIRELKKEESSFEMYVMLGAWINCENAWTHQPNHAKEDKLSNRLEIDKAVKLANQYRDIVKIISVGNEAMVHWASNYFVTPSIILKWVAHLQLLKNHHKLPKDLWITSSDNYASWGGGDDSYHNDDLNALIREVDYVSVHTYPFHDTHYNPSFWELNDSGGLDDMELIEQNMERAARYAISQFNAVISYMERMGITKPVHIGETGWANQSNGFYGNNGSHAADQYKQALYYQHIQSWSKSKNITCFYFEAFDEKWKDAENPNGSENHFGLFTVDGKAKYAIWKQVDQGVFSNLSRDGNTIRKTYKGSKEKLLNNVFNSTLLYE